MVLVERSRGSDSLSVDDAVSGSAADDDDDAVGKSADAVAVPSDTRLRLITCFDLDGNDMIDREN